MNYYTMNQASRELGITRQELIKRIREKQIKAEKLNTGVYRIASSEVKRLARKLEREEAELDKELGNIPEISEKKASQYYTITQASEKLGIKRTIVSSLVKSRKIDVIKGKSPTSRYLIHEDQIPKLYELTFSDQQHGQVEILPAEIDVKKAKSFSSLADKQIDDLMQIQKNISESIRYISITQQQIVSVIQELMKKAKE